MKNIEVIYSWTIDLAIWDCPECGHRNQATEFNEDDGCCEECGFQIPDYCSRMGECDNEINLYQIKEEE